MRTNIEIDEKLLAQAMAATGARTKRQAVNEALETVVRLRKQREILKLRGKLKWEGDLEAMRLD